MKWSFILFLPAVASLVWPLCLLLGKRHVLPAQVILCLTLVLEAFAMMIMAVFFRGQAGSLFIYDYIFIISCLLSPPFFYIGVCSLTEPRGVTFAQRQVFAAPLLFILAFTVGAFVVGPRRYELLCQQIRLGSPSADLLADRPTRLFYLLDHYLFLATLLAVGLPVIIASTRRLRLFQHRFNNYYASSIHAPKLDTRVIIALTALFLPLMALAVATVSFRPPYYKYLLVALSVMLAALQFFIGRFVFSLSHDARSLANYIRNKH